jgi:subtilisin family serine protease
MTGHPFPSTLEHPAAGTSNLDPERLAVRWAAGADTTAKQSIIDRLGLIPAAVAAADSRPAIQVNRTDALWWLQRGDGAAIDAGIINELNGSELVEWVSPGYRAAPGIAGDAGGGAPTLFAVNPTRVWVRQDALAAMAGAPTLRPFGVEAARPSRIPGYAVVPVQEGIAHVAAGHLAAAVADRGGAERSVRLETVPFYSPTTTRTMSGPATFAPDDPLFNQQWSLRCTEVPAAWDIARGDPSIVVAVLDEGVELGHPDLDLYPDSWNASTDTPDGGPVGNHGTACAGIVAARTDNATGVAGIAGGCRVMAIATATWADVDIAEGLYFAADNGARVVSMSFGVYPEWNAWDFDLIRDALQHAYDQGILLVAAAGNEDGPVARFPGSDSRTLCVGGSNRSDERKRTNDSSVEPFWGASYGPDVDVVAPCVEISTTDRLGADGYDVGDYYGGFNGTSSATPLVAGLGALLLSARHDLDNVSVRHIIESTCDQVSPALYAYRNVPHKPSGPWHEETGYGRINAARAVQAAMNAR